MLIKNWFAALKKKQTLPHGTQETEEKVEEKPEELKQVFKNWSTYFH